MTDKFWMVFLEGQGNPTVQHADVLLARAEAERLSKSTGRRAYLMEAMVFCERADVYWSDIAYGRTAKGSTILGEERHP